MKCVLEVICIRKYTNAEIIFKKTENVLHYNYRKYYFIGYVMLRKTFRHVIIYLTVFPLAIITSNSRLSSKVLSFA